MRGERPTVVDHNYQSRRFVVFRKHDVSGVSGTGVIAEGICFPNGKTVMHWITPGKPQSMGVYESPEELIEIHGHEGATELVWVD